MATDKEVKDYVRRADKRADLYFELRKKGYTDEEAKRMIFEEVPE